MLFYAKDCTGSAAALQQGAPRTSINRPMQDWTADQTFDSRSEPLVFVRDMASVLALLDNCAVQLWESKSQTHKLPTNPIPSLADDPAMLVDAKDCSAKTEPQWVATLKTMRLRTKELVSRV